MMANSAGMLKESERSGTNHSMRGNSFCCFKIALEIRVIHELHIAEIREPLTAYRVAGKITVEPQVQTGQVVDRVCILAAGQPSDGDLPRIAGVLLGVHRRRRELRLGRGDLNLPLVGRQGDHIAGPASETYVLSVFGVRNNFDVKEI